MGIKTTTYIPGRRFQTILDFSEITRREAGEKLCSSR